MKSGRLLVLVTVGTFTAGCADDQAVDNTATITSAVTSCPTTYTYAGMNGQWTDGMIWYHWDPSLPQAKRDIVRAGMDDWMAGTDGAIGFIEAPGNRSVLFSADPDCIGSGADDVVFAAGACGNGGRSLRHELGHLLGFDHHHQRSDRDRHLALMDSSLFICNPDGSGGGDSVWTKVADNSPYPAAGIGPGSTFGRFDFASVMVYGSLGHDGCASPNNCLLPTPGGGGGDPSRSFVKRGVSTGGVSCAPGTNTNSCPADLKGDWEVISAHDRASLAEAYSTTKLWSPGVSMATDVGSQAPLAFQLASNVFAVGNPGLAALSAGVRSAVTRGSDGNIYISAQVPGSAWTNLGKPTGTLSGDPAVVSWSQSRIDVAVVSQSGGVKRVYKRAFDNGSWEAAWVLVPGTQPSDLTGGIAMASWGVNRLDIFANAGSRIRHQAWTGSNWTAWDNPGGAVPGGTASTPAAVSWDANRIDVVVKAADNQIWQLTWDNGWSPWTGVSGANGTNSAPTIASWGPGRLDIFVRSDSGQLWQETCAAGPCKGSGWTGWIPLGGFLSSGPAAASARGYRRIDVVSLSDDGQALPTPTNQLGMWHRYWPWPYADRHSFDAGDDHGNPEFDAWTGTTPMFKADCSSAYKTMTVGLSVATGTARAHSILCGSDAQVLWNTQNVIDFRADSVRSDGAGHQIPWGSAPDWDSGYFKGQCAIDEVVTGVAQESGGRLGSLRCSKMPTGKALRGACTTRTFSQTNNRGSENAGDWAYGFYKNQCADGEGVVGVSATTSAGAAHAIRCCRIVMRTRGDWDGDGRADYSLRRPSDGSIHVRTFAGVEIVKPQLVSGSVPETLDVDGDGLTDTVFRRTSDYTWFFNRTTGGITDSTQWGTTGDMIAIGDYDGDRRDDFTVVRPGQPNLTWWIRPGDTSLPPLATVSYGATGDIPVPGDYDGDGRDDVAYWNPSTGNWYVIPTSTGIGQFWLQWGASGDIPVPGDYDGDGKTDPAVFRPASGTAAGTWFVRRSSEAGYGYEPALVWSPSSGVTRLPRDYDGDGRTDKAYFNPSDNSWHVMETSSGAEVVTTFGQSGDTPF